MSDKIHKDIRVFRFTKELVVRRGLEGRSSGPVPIFSDANKIIGFATITNDAGAVMAECAIDPSNPERLDLETESRSYWLDAALEYRGFYRGSQEDDTGFHSTIVWVQALCLTSKEIEGQNPVTGGSLE